MQTVTAARYRISIATATRFMLRSIAIGVITPELEAGVIRLVGQPVIDVVIKAAIIDRIGVGRIGDPAGRIVGYGADIATDWVSFEPAIWWIAASGESTVQFIRRTVVWYNSQISWRSNIVNRVRLCMFIYSILPNTVNNARISYSLTTKLIYYSPFIIYSYYRVMK